MNDDILIEREEVLGGLLKELEDQKDWRIDRCKKFSLAEILFLVLCAQLCDFQSFRHYELYGKLKIDLLRMFLPYKKGIPSRSTIARILALFSPELFSALFTKWMQRIVEKSVPNEQQKVIAIDGKSHNGVQEDNLHLVSAFDTQAGLTLGQEKVADKSNEITAIPVLIDSLAIAGHIVSIDAMGCQTAIAEKIRSKKADYFLAVKGNQGELFQDFKDAFENKKFLKTCNVVTRHDKGHGRLEARTCYASDKVDWISQKSRWKDLKSMIMIESKRTVKGKESIERRFFISSASADSDAFLTASRSHWGIENSLHWVLDVVFGEDDRVIWNKNIAQNESTICKIALNLLKMYRLIRPTATPRSEKISIKGLRKVASLSDSEMIKILTGII